jgi:preprotein translocase subunit SecD
MLQFQTWKVVLILGICLFGLLSAAPNVYPPAFRTWLAKNAPIIPHKPITLGLDLQGGVYGQTAESVG